MALRPTDIPRPGVARDPGVRASPSTVQLARRKDPRGAAMEDVAAATRRTGQATGELAQRTARRGAVVSDAMRGQASALQQQGEVVSQSASIVAQAQVNFAKTLGGITDTFLAFAQQRQKAADQAYANRWELEEAKAVTPVMLEHLDTPGEGASYIQEGDDKIAKVHEEVSKRVSADLGYEPSDVAKAQITALGFDKRANAARNLAVASNNRHVAKIVESTQTDILDVQKEAVASGDLGGSLAKVDDMASTLDGVLTPEQSKAFKKAARSMVYEGVVKGHLERGQTNVAEAIVGQLTGFSGEKSSVNHRLIVDAAKAEGVDPLVQLAISRFETGGTFSSKIRPMGKNGKPLSSAAGLFQMTSENARAYLGTDSAASASASTQAAGGAKFTKDHIRGLTQTLGRTPTPGEVYVAHLLGFGRAVRVLNADPDTSLTKLLPDEVIKNNHLTGKNVGDMLAWSQGIMQTNMEAVVGAGIIDGRKVDALEAGIPLDEAFQLSGIVESYKRAAARDPDIAEARKEISKTGYDMMFADKMDVKWLEANRDILGVSDYKAFLHSLQPGGTTRKTDPQEYLKLYDMANNDPATAADTLRDMYGRDEIARGDFDKLFSLAQKNQQGRSYSTELRDYVKKQLQPDEKSPKSAYARQLDALFSFDDWLEAHPGAKREEIRKESQTIVDDFRRIRYATGVTEMPPPRFVGVPREQIDSASLAIAKQKVIEELKKGVANGGLSEKDAAEQAALLRRWEELLKHRDAK